jgi:predicted RNase H-like HicB family nuclease
VKRSELIRWIRTAARSADLTWEVVREGSAHEVWRLAGRQITIPRHREINEVTATAIMRDLETRVGRRMMAPMRSSYTVSAERHGDWWAITVDELRGVFSQARRLTQVESMARDAIALFLEVPTDSFGLSVREKLTPDAERVVAAAKEARAAAIAHQEVASERSRAAARTLAEQGLPQRDIGRLLDLSHQRVAQLLEAAPDGSSSPSVETRRRRSPRVVGFGR